MNDLFDTPAYKLVRRDDPDTSHDAAESLPVSDMEKIVADTIAIWGDRRNLRSGRCPAASAL